MPSRVSSDISSSQRSPAERLPRSTRCSKTGLRLESSANMSHRFSYSSQTRKIWSGFQGKRKHEQGSSASVSSSPLSYQILKPRHWDLLHLHLVVALGPPGLLLYPRPHLSGYVFLLTISTSRTPVHQRLRWHARDSKIRWELCTIKMPSS